jgi:hypothetical protein
LSSPGAPSTEPATVTPTTTSSIVASPTTPTPQHGSVGAVLRAVTQAQRSHELAPSAAQDLRNRLRDIGQTLAQGHSADAAHQLTDLQHQLTDLQQQHKLDAAGAQRISAAVGALAATLPA